MDEVILITAKRKDFTWLPWGSKLPGFLVGGWLGVTVLFVHKWTSTAKEWVGGMMEIRAAVEYRQKMDRIFNPSAWE